jgi:uncharacterized lipoprotein YmbA
MPTKLKTVVDDISAVPEAFRTQYKPIDGSNKFMLQEVEIPDPVDVSGLAKKTEELLKEKKALEAKYAGIDPDRYQALLKAREADERSKLEGKGAWEALEQQLKDRHAQELKQLESRVGSLTRALEQNMIDAEATAAISAARGAPALLLPHVKEHVRVFEEDGRFVAKVVDANGNPRIGDAKGSPMTIKQLVEEMKFSEIFGRAFEATYARGSGAPANGGRSRAVATITRETFNQMDAAERAEYFRNKGVVID